MSRLFESRPSWICGPPVKFTMLHGMRLQALRLHVLVEQACVAGDIEREIAEPVLHADPQLLGAAQGRRAAPSREGRGQRHAERSCGSPGLPCATCEFHLDAIDVTSAPISRCMDARTRDKVTNAHAHEDSSDLDRRSRKRQARPDPRRRGRLRGQQAPACRQRLRRPRGQDHRCDGQAGGAWLHRHARALRAPRLAPAHHRHRPAHVLRPAVPGDLRAQGGQGGQRRPALSQARGCRLRRGVRAQRRLHRRGAAAQRRHDIRRVRQPAAACRTRCWPR